jgi:hypothetical protein
VSNQIVLNDLQTSLLALATYASDPAEADCLRFLASPAGKVRVSGTRTNFLHCMESLRCEIYQPYSLCRTTMLSGL